MKLEWNRNVNRMRYRIVVCFVELLFTRLRSKNQKNLTKLAIDIYIKLKRTFENKWAHDWKLSIKRATCLIFQIHCCILAVKFAFEDDLWPHQKAATVREVQAIHNTVKDTHFKAWRDSSWGCSYDWFGQKNTLELLCF